MADPPLRDPVSASLFDQVRREAANEKLAGLSDADLAALANALDAFLDTRPSGAHAVRVRPAAGEDGRPLDSDVLEAAGPDMPFLVDSLLNACSARGLAVNAMFHPIVEHGGDRVSVIQIHVPPLSDPERDELKAEAEATLRDVRDAVLDYADMRALMRREIETLSHQDHLDPAARDEAIAFLRWLAEEHFVFLGARSYVFEKGPHGDFLPEEPTMVEGSNLGLLREEARNVLNRGAEPTVLTPEIGAFLAEPQPLIIAKSTLVSRVHRRVRADYVGIKRYGADGAVSGEVRFAGLFTAEAYDETARSIPLIRRRVAKVIEASGARPGGHSAKALANLLESWPRDELFQADAETLTPMLLGALALIGRPRARLFVREDRFGRFVTAIVYVPRDAYDSDLRRRIASRLEAAYHGELVRFEPNFDANALARVHFEIALQRDHPEPDLARLEAEIAAIAATWDDAFRSALSASGASDVDAANAMLFRGAFSAGYREAFTPEEAISDVKEMAALGPDAPIRMRAFRLEADEAHVLRAKIYSREGSVPLSDCVPVLEDMGLFVEFETGYAARPAAPPAPDAPKAYWIHAVSMRTRDGAPVDLGAAAARFEEAFVDVWRGRAENDGFNQLVLAAGATSREAALIRALSAFRTQTGLDPARDTQIRAFAAHPKMTRRILDLFVTRFDPLATGSLETRAARAEDQHAAFVEALSTVASLDEDRVLRRTADLVMAIQRTNFYQRHPGGAPMETIAFKIASRELEDLPGPKPHREIFVASPQVEGCHLRFGPVARGGLRWSDRRDDFRTEVLGLVKAQQVKNAVIVPVGSKGGFFPKQLPPGGSREAVREAGVAAYRAFITSLLGLTDNLVDGETRHPKDTVVWDGEDAYLVVAADKGTATFSDIANEISESLGFWLGDAFASGGSAGYDHKKMGITARGAWEAVKRHFREAGKDIQAEPFTVIGCGDMSGDVFGNGMLLSKQIRLLAAFNHLHIFIDPDPKDTERLWAERKRLFEMERSSWSDYDAALISKGGGVFERSAKSIPLSDEIKALTGLARDAATPAELIHALLKSEAELLWFGGIGTYVKAAHESHADVGDRANDGLRVDAADLSVKVIGEGANLGATQAARIEFARAGGRVNTDAIDNSAGVDSSDHEVNIKILASEAIRAGALARGERNARLAAMTDDVAAHVLRHNYDQTGALTLAEATAARDMEAHERLMAYLEGRGVLDRDLEGLPDTERMRERRESGAPLTRPELAVLLAWSKIVLFDDLLASETPDDPWFAALLKSYFPDGVRDFETAMAAHPLRREIISTVLANRLLDAGGPAFFQRLRETTEADPGAVARACEAARTLLNWDGFTGEIDALDNTVSAETQTQLRLDGLAGLASAAAWIAEHEPSAPLAELTGAYEEKLDAFKGALKDVSGPYGAARIERRARTHMRAGVDEPLARWAAAMTQFGEGVSIVSLSNQVSAPVAQVAALYYELGDLLKLDRLRAAAEDSLADAPYWDRVASRRLAADLSAQQSAAALDALRHGGAARAWLETRPTKRADLLDTLHGFGRGQTWSFSRFVLAADAIRRYLALER